MRRFSIAVAILGITILPALAEGQVSLTEVLGQIRNGRSAKASDLLGGHVEGASQQVMDQLADSLVAMILDPSTDGSVAQAARSALGRGGSARSVRVPYGRSFDLLVQVFEETRQHREVYGGIAAAVLVQVTRLPQTGRVLDFLQGVAESEDETLAWTAIEQMYWLMEQPGLQRLRLIYERGSIVTEPAASRLRQIAKKEGWAG